MYLGKPIAPTKIYAGCIAEYEKIWTDCKDIINNIEKATKNAEVDSPLYFAPAGTFVQEGDSIISNYRSNKHLGLSHASAHNEFMRELNNRFFFTLLDTVAAYKETFAINEEIQHKEGYNILKYQTGEEYKAHYDGGSQTGRCISPILYLNDNYTGGELEFVNFDLKIKPKAGSLYIFPATFPYRHIAHPVETGTKYAIVTWLHDLVA